jgi:nitroimidazol reductase NimA-like FMN-containing flavoprotein (pyridoxamine 5'-phosphate oxidase superfamily)
MIIQEMSHHDCREMLARTEIARLACALDDQPYIVPIRIDVDRDWLYAYSTLGEKIKWLRHNPLVCVEIDQLTSRREWVSVIIFGRYEELPPAASLEGSRRIAERLFQQHAMWWEPGVVPVTAQAARAPVVFRIHIDRITGRRGKPEADERVHDRPGDNGRRTGVDGVARMIGERLRAHIK